jgi:5-methylcytosine-specific restriction protein A
MFIYLWNYYITEERIADLKKEYNNFKNGLIAQNEILVNYDEYKKEIVDKISQLELCFYGDFPRPIYEANKMDYKQNKRDLITSYNALKLANFKCEYSNQHKSFMRKNIDLTYTEGHHLIPLKYQYMFNVNLDVEANIVSLCSECHNILHYGRDYEILLRKLYDARIDRLNTCGIKISIDELLEMYK